MLPKNIHCPLKQFQREQRVRVRMHWVPLSGAAVMAVIGEGWAGSDAVRTLRREGRGTKQVTTEPSLPCCRRPSLCGACPGPPADSPGTAEAPRAGSAWRRGPWSLESKSELSQSAILLHASLPHTLQGGNSQCPRRRADTIPAFLGKISNDASDKIPAGFLSKAV